jgi:hypothetical protein
LHIKIFYLGILNPDYYDGRSAFVKALNKIMSSVFLVGYIGCCSAVAQASTSTGQSVTPKNGDIAFRVGSSKSTVISGARVIVINHDGNIIGSGLTNSSGVWNTSVPLYKVDWNEHFSTKGIVNAIVIANGYNEQAVFVVPITEHTIQPVVLQPVMQNGRNEPSESLGNFSNQDLQKYIARYASELGLKKQPPISGDLGYAPWSPEQMKTGNVVV